MLCGIRGKPGKPILLTGDGWKAARKAEAEAERRRGGPDEQTKDQMRSEAQMRRRLWDIADAAKEAKRRRRRAEEWSRTAS